MGAQGSGVPNFFVFVFCFFFFLFFPHASQGNCELHGLRAFSFLDFLGFFCLSFFSFKLQPEGGSKFKVFFFFPELSTGFFPAFPLSV